MQYIFYFVLCIVFHECSKFNTITYPDSLLSHSLSICVVQRVKVFKISTHNHQWVQKNNEFLSNQEHGVWRGMNEYKKNENENFFWRKSISIWRYVLFKRNGKCWKKSSCVEMNTTMMMMMMMRRGMGEEEK